MEEWRAIDNYEDYEVSNLGRVRSIDRIRIDSWGRKYSLLGQILKQSISISKGNYPQALVTIYKNRKAHRVLVHRLVAKAFIDNPNNLPQVNHKDENSLNNSANNLEWCDATYNVNYGMSPLKRANARKRKINVFDSNHSFIETLSSGKEASSKYNVSKGSVSHSCHNHCKTKGYYFELV